MCAQGCNSEESNEKWWPFFGALPRHQLSGVVAVLRLPHECTISGKAFATSDHLTARMRTHSWNRPYASITCGRALSELGDLTRNHKDMHALRVKGPAGSQPRAFFSFEGQG